MARQIEWTDEANRWLKDIHSHIAQENHAAADRIVAGIYDKAQRLKEHPRLGYQYEEVTEYELRILLFGHFRIAYVINSEEMVTVIGVFHAALDIDRYL